MQSNKKIDNLQEGAVLQNGGGVGIRFPATNLSSRIWVRDAMNLGMFSAENSVKLFPPWPSLLQIYH
jgi:hypothetical protein